MQAKNLFFRCRMSKQDWLKLQMAVQKDNPELRVPAWIIHQTTKFCKNYALPLLERHGIEADPKNNPKIERTIWIPERIFDGTTNIEVLERFAEHKGKNPTQLIQRYILDPRIRDEEIKMLGL